MLTPFDLPPSPPAKGAASVIPPAGAAPTDWSETYDQLFDPDPLVAARGIGNGLVVTGLGAGVLCLGWMLVRMAGWL